MTDERREASDPDGAATACLVGLGTPLDWFAERLVPLVAELDRASGQVFGCSPRRQASRVGPFTARIVTSASVSHDEASPALDAEGVTRFHRLVLPQLDAAYSFARFLSRDADAAHDIVQDAFLRACRHFASFRDGNVRAWLFAIVRNCHHDWRVARARTARYEADPGPGEEDDAESSAPLDRVASEEDTPEAALIRKTEAERVRAVLFGLPAPSREVLVLRELEQLSYREIAAVTGLPIGTVMSRLARARNEFAQAWTRDALKGETRP